MSSTATGRANPKADYKDDNYCFLQVSIAGGPPQRIIIQLYRDKVPETCANFAALCQAPGTTSPSRPIPTYRGSIFHRIVPGFMVQGGDFERFDGTGGHAVIVRSSSSSSSRTFPDENFSIPHDKAGVVSMANKGADSNGSQFFICLQQTPHLNQKHVAFGQVVKGMKVVQSMATDVELEGSRPTAMQKIIIVDCGMGRGEGKHSGSSDDISDENSHRIRVDRKEKRKHRKKKETKKDKAKKHKKDCRRRKHHTADRTSDSEDDSKSEDPSREKKRHKKERHRKRSHSSRRKKKKRRDSDSDSASSSSSRYSSSEESERRHRRKRKHR